MTLDFLKCRSEHTRLSLHRTNLTGTCLFIPSSHLLCNIGFFHNIWKPLKTKILFTETVIDNNHFNYVMAWHITT